MPCTLDNVQIHMRLLLLWLLSLVLLRLLLRHHSVHVAVDGHEFGVPRACHETDGHGQTGDVWPHVALCVGNGNERMSEDAMRSHEEVLNMMSDEAF